MNFKTVMIPIKEAQGLRVLQHREYAQGCNRHVYDYKGQSVMFGTLPGLMDAADEVIHDGFIENWMTPEAAVRAYLMEPVVISKTVYNLVEGEPSG